MEEDSQQKSVRNRNLILAVTNDLVIDHRIDKVANTLLKMGYRITCVGRRLPKSKEILNRPYSIKRFSLWFNTGPLFYVNYNIRLFIYLLFKRYDVVVANDLDTLLACFMAAKIRRSELVYDSHEYFTEVPELVNRPWIKRRWEGIEKALLPQVRHCYTVCQSIADIYNKRYGNDFKVVRNVPPFQTKIKHNGAIKPSFPTDKPVILYQGAINIGRGLEEAIMAMHSIDIARLVIIGDGPLFDQYRLLVQSEELQEKVIMTGRVPFEDLRYLTPHASIGLSVEKDIGLNYRYALPNKLFDYIHAGVPVLASNLPEIQAVVKQHKVGVVIQESTAENIAKAVNEMLSSPERMETWKENCKLAAPDLCWEKEEEIIRVIYQPFL